jgi:hypothetical protein
VTEKSDSVVINLSSDEGKARRVQVAAALFPQACGQFTLVEVAVIVGIPLSGKLLHSIC